MGEDISTGAKIGIVLCILVFLIAIIFSLLTVVRNITNSEAAQMQNGLDQMTQSQFADYDQKNVTGTQVMSAINIFDGQNIAIVVRTGSCQKASSEYINGFNYGALLTGYEACATEQTADGTAYKLKTKLEKETGHGFYTRNLSNEDGSYKYNLNTRPCTTSGTSSYVRSSAKFFAELIKDNTGSTVGICFTQVTGFTA